MKTHLVVDVVYQDSPVFAGTPKECQEWKTAQGFGYKVVPMTRDELRFNNPELLAKSGRFYHKLPLGMDVEVWDRMTVVERLNHMNLIVNK